MPHLEELVEEVHESSSVSELDGGDVVYIARVPTKRIMTVTISVGTRFPAYATSMGRVLLAAQPEPWLDAYLSTASLHHLTGHTITTASGLRQELRKIRARGWALIDQELEEGLRSLAAPIRDPDGTVIAAVNVATHAGRRSLDSIVADLLSPLLATAERIERDLASARTTAAATAAPRARGDLTDAGGPPDTRAGYLTHLCSMRTLLADHPLVTHKLTLLRAATTDNATFRMLASELVTLLAYEATRDVRVTPVEVTTPVAAAHRRHAGRAQAADRPGAAGRDRHARRDDPADADGQRRLRRHGPRRGVARRLDLRQPAARSTWPGARCSCSTRCSPPAAPWSR